MYGYLKSLIGHRLAMILTALTYAVLIVLVLYSVFEPQAELKYLAL
jgi:hypothetical protein